MLNANIMNSLTTKAAICRIPINALIELLQLDDVHSSAIIALIAMSYLDSDIHTAADKLKNLADELTQLYDAQTQHKTTH